MKRTILLLVMLLGLCTAAWSETIWQPTWAWKQTFQHVIAVDRSTNCVSNEDNSPSILVKMENGFYYRMNHGKNTPENPGNLLTDYYITDAITLTKGGKYTLSFNLETNWTYKYLSGSKAKVELVSEASGAATLVQSIGTVDTHKNLGGSIETQSLPFVAAEGGTAYLRLTFSGRLEASTFTTKFSKFAISDGATTKPVITQQPVSELDIDESNSYTLSVAATGEGLQYQWQKKYPYTSWLNIDGANSASYQVEKMFYCPQIQFQCIVSNPAGSEHSEPSRVNTVTLHGFEFPENSGEFYTTFYGSERMELDANTQAYIAKYNNNSTALEHSEVTDKFIPRDVISKGLVLKSTRADIVLKTPTSQTSNFNYSENVLTGSVNETAATDSAIYNLHGQRVKQKPQALPKGVYIIKGKKLTTK